MVAGLRINQLRIIRTGLLGHKVLKKEGKRDLN